MIFVYFILPSSFSPHLCVNRDVLTILQFHRKRVYSVQTQNIYFHKHVSVVSPELWQLSILTQTTFKPCSASVLLLNFFFSFIGFLVKRKTQPCEILFINSSFRTGFVDQEILESLARKNKQTNKPKRKKWVQLPELPPSARLQSDHSKSKQEMFFHNGWLRGVWCCRYRAAGQQQ